MTNENTAIKSEQRREQGPWRIKLLLRAKLTEQWTCGQWRFLSRIACSLFLHFFSPSGLEDEQAQKPYTNILLVLPLQSYSKGKILYRFT